MIEQFATRRPDQDGEPDTRTVPQRHSDVLIELCQRARAAGEFPTTGGELPHVTVTMTDRPGWAKLTTRTLTAATQPFTAERQRPPCFGRTILLPPRPPNVITHREVEGLGGVA